MPRAVPRIAVMGGLLILLAGGAAATRSAGRGMALHPLPPVGNDPHVIFSSRLDPGGARAGGCAAIAVDGAGDSYVTGSMDGDAYVARISPDGDSVAMLATLGGSGEDAGTGVALGPDGDIYLTGLTRSGDFPEAGPGPRAPAGAQTDLFVARWKPDGRLVYSRRIGGSADDAPAAIVVDAKGRATVAGVTSSPDFPVTRGAAQDRPGGGADAFVLRLSASGARLLDSTYLGGSGADRATAIAQDARGGLFVAGVTGSADFPRGGTAQDLFHGGDDAFVVKLDLDGSGLTRTLLLGGEGDDVASALALDAAGDLYVAGTTRSPDFPGRGETDALSTAPGNAGAARIFVARVETAGDEPQYAVRPAFPDAAAVSAEGLDPQPDEQVAGIALDPAGALFVARVVPSTGSSGVLKLSPDGSTVEDVAWLGQPGGLNLQPIAALARGTGGNLHVTGGTRPAVEPRGSESPFVALLSFGGASLAPPCTINFTNAAGTGLWQDAGNWDAVTPRVPDPNDEACIDAAYDVTLSSGFHVVHSLTSQGSLSLQNSALLSLTTASQIADFAIGTGATLSGAGTITVTGSFTWEPSTITGPNNNAAVLNLHGDTTINGFFENLSHRKVNATGTTTVTTSFNIDVGGTFNNMGTLHLQGGMGSSLGTFNNVGLLEKANSSTSTLSVNMNNTGTIDVQNGVLKFSGSFTQTAGDTHLGGGQVSTTLALNLRGGTLSGSGTITGNVLPAGGTISPGSSPGVLNINGDVSMSPNFPSTLSVEVGGLTPGTQFDQINVGGLTAAATLSGTLNIANYGGFQPSPGDRIDIMTFLSRTGTFSTVNAPPPAGGVQWTVSYGPNAVSLVAASQQRANLSLNMDDSPDPVLKDGTLHYTLAVHNAGPDAATGVTVTDPLPGDVTFLGATGAGWSCSTATGPVVCTLASLASGASSSVVIDVTPTVGPLVLLNSASVTGTETDLVPGNNATQAITQVTLLSSDLSLTRTDAPDPVRAGADLVYDLDVSNAGPDPASSMTLVATLPAGSTFVGATGLGWGCVHSSGTVTCTSGAIGVGGSTPISIHVLAPLAGGVVTSSATVVSSSADPDATNNVKMESTTVLPPESDLSVLLTDAPDPVGSFAALTYSIVAGNAGPDPASPVTVTVTLPAGAVFVSAQGGGWTCQQAAGVVTCARGRIDVGDQPVIDITMAAPGVSGQVSATAVISASVSDASPANNTSIQSTTVFPSHADLSITKTDSADPVYAGEAETYTIQVVNAGPDPATSVTVTDLLPPGALNRSMTGSGWTCGLAAGTVTCTRPLLPVGAAPPIVVEVTAPLTGGLISNQASVTAGTDDPVTANNTATQDTIVVRPSADLSITQTDAPDPVMDGQPLTYTLTVRNNGPDTVKTVKVVDTLPVVAFTDYGGAGWICSKSGLTILCTRPDLPPGVPATITIFFDHIFGTGTLTNSATVSAVADDPEPANDTSSEQTTILEPDADVSVTNSDAPDPVLSGTPVTYTVTATNSGPLNATGLRVTDTLPPQLEFLSSTPSPDSMQTDPNGVVTLSYDVGALPARTATPIVISARCVTPDPAILTTASVSATSFDGMLGNNTAVATTNCIGVSGSLRFGVRTVTATGTNTSMPATLTLPGETIDPTSVRLTSIDSVAITPLTGTPGSGGTFNFNRLLVARAIETRLKACTPLEGVPVTLQVQGRTMTGGYFVAQDTITFVKKSLCAGGAASCVKFKPTSIKATAFSPEPVQATIGLCLGKFDQNSVKVTHINGEEIIPPLSVVAHPTRPDRVILNREALKNAMIKVVDFCPEKQILGLTVTLQGTVPGVGSFSASSVLNLNCGSGV